MSMLVTLVYATEDKAGLEAAENKCIGYVKELAKAGDTHGYIWMADALANGRGIQKDVKKAIEFYEKAAEAGDTFGYECIGEIYYKGEDVPADYDKAHDYFTEGFHQEETAQFLYTVCHDRRNMVSGNPSPQRSF